MKEQLLRGIAKALQLKSIEVKNFIDDVLDGHGKDWENDVKHSCPITMYYEFQKMIHEEAE